MNKIDTITFHVGHTVDVEVTPTIERAIELARAERASGKSKIAAARYIYPNIAGSPREAIWYAIIHGVTISSRGAVTYYYKLRQEFKRATG